MGSLLDRVRLCRDRLGDCGLLVRRTSPNGKRDPLRDAADLRLAYGIDLVPLFALRVCLQTLARHARLDGLDPVRMFRASTAARQDGRACIPA